MKRLTLGLLVASVVGYGLTGTPRPRATAAESPAVEPVAEKARKYHAILRRRPEPGYLFDRFYNTWLDDSTVEKLRQFLTEQAASGETSDRLLLAFFHGKQGDDAAALEAYNQALADAPGSAAALYHKAAAEARTLDFDAAIADLEQARSLDPSDKLRTKIDKQLGKLLVRNRETEKALAVWKQLLDANPNDEDLQEDVLELHIEEGLYDDAAQLAQQMIERTRDKYLAVTRRLRLGDIHYRAGSRQKALDTYATALTEVGHDTWIEREILAQIEELFRREDDLAGARKYFETLIEQHPKRVALHQRRARLLVDLGEHEEAQAAHQAILQLTPGDRANREAFITMLARIEKHAEAIAQLGALIEQHPDDAELKFRLATMLADADRTDDAVTAVREYLAASEKSEYAFLRSARQLQRMERPDAAGKIYQEMVDAFPESSAAQDAQASFLYGQGQKDEALAVWKQLAAEGDQNQTLHVARALMTRGEKEAAYELLARRADQFADEPLFLGQLVTAALTQEEYEAAVRWARRRVRLAQQPAELFSAIDQAALACERADKIDQVAEELSQMTARTIQQTCLLAELRETSGDSRAADRVLAEAAEAKHILAVSQQIRLYEARRQWDKAAEATRRLLDLPGGRKSVHVRRLVELYARDYKFAEALPWIDVWKQISPGSTLPWITEARLLEQEGRMDDALQAIRKAVQKFEDDADLRARLAQMYAESDRPADAEQLYWQLYEATEDLSGKLRWVQELAKLAETQGKIEQLVASFDERRRTNRQSIVPLLALSEIHRVADNFEERRQALTTATQIKPDDLQLLLQIARIEETEGHWEQAVATLEKAAAMDDSGKAKRRIAQLHLTYGDEEKGFALLLELAGEQEADARAIEAVADAMVGLHDWERAADFLAEQIDNYPADYRLRYLYGIALEESGRLEGATRQFLLLLEDQEELPSKKNKQTAGSRLQNTYYQSMARMMPPQAVEWLTLSQYRHTAYTHQRQRGGGLYLTTSGGRQGSVIQYPPSAEQVRPFALTHLIVVASLLEEERLAELSSDLEAAGIDDAELLIEHSATQNGLRQNLPQVLDEHPDHEAALALFVVFRIGQQSHESPQHLRRAYELFRDEYPELAFLAAMQAGQASRAEEAVQEEPTETSGESETPSSEMFDAALELAESIEKPGPTTVITTSMLLGGYPGQRRQVNRPLGEKYRQQFSQLLLKWYPIIQKDRNFGRYGFVYVLRALEANGDAAAYLDFLTDEVARFESQSGRRNNVVQSMYRGPQDQRFLEPLGFPPAQLATFPAHILTVLHPPGGRDPFGQANETAHFFDAEEMLPRLSKLSSPVLRILLAMKLEGDAAEKMVDETLEAMLTAESPQLDAYLLAAGQAVQDGRLAEGLRLLQKSRFLPMKRDLRQAVDAAIVAVVLELRGTGSQTEEGVAQAVTKFLGRLKDAVERSEQQAAGDPSDYLEAGRDAALRLRRSRLDAQKRIELATALDDLGLAEEAERLEQATAAAPTSTLVASGRTYAAPRAGSVATDRVTKLMKAGKRDAAVRLLASEVTNHARQLLSSPGNASYYKQQFSRSMSSMYSLNLDEEVFEHLDSGKSRNTQRVAEFAAVCELFDKPEAARAAYERLLAARPRDEQTRMRLAVLLAKTDLSAAREHLLQISPSMSQQFGQALWQMMQDHQATIQERLNYGHLAYEYLASTADDPRAQNSWATTAVQILAQPLHHGNQRLPWLYQRATSEQKVLQGLEESHNERIALHRAFCHQMLEMPGLQRTGFMHRLAAAEAAGRIDLAVSDVSENVTSPADNRAEDQADNGAGANDEAGADVRPATADDSSDDADGERELAATTDQSDADDVPSPLTSEGFREVARELLLAEAKAPGRPSPSGVHFYSSNSDSVPFRSPEEFLVRVAAARGEWNSLDDELLPMLEEGRGRDAAKRLRRYAALYRCPPEEFLEAAKAVVKLDSPLPGQHQSIGGLPLVIQIWQDRGLEVDLLDLVSTTFRRDAAASRTNRAPSYLVDYLSSLAARDRREAASELLETIASQYLGPAKRRQKLIKQHYQQHSWSSGSINGNIHLYGNLLEQLLQDPQIAFVALEHLEPLGESAPVSNLEYRTGSLATSIVREEEPQAVVAALERSPWLADAEDFSVVAVGGEVAHWPLVQLLDQLRNQWSKKPRRKELIELLSAKDVFGARLLAAYLDEDEPEQAVLAEMAVSLDAIEQMPQEQQRALAALLRHQLGDINKWTHSEKPELPAVRNWFDRQLGSRSEQILRRFIDAKKLEDLGVEQHGLDVHLAHVMQELALSDLAAAATVFRRTAELAEEAQRRGQYHTYQGGGQSFAGTLLDRVCMHWRRQDADLSSYLVLMEIIESSNDPPLEVGHNVRRCFTHLLDHAFEEHSEEKEGQPPPTKLEAIQSLYRTTSDLLGDRSGDLLLEGFSDLIRQKLDAAPTGDLIAWIEATPADEAEATDLRSVLELAARANAFRRDARKADAAERDDFLEEAPTQRMYGLVQDRLSNDRQLPAVRIAVLEMLREGKDFPLPADVRQAAIELYDEAIRAGVPLLATQHRMLLEVALSTTDAPDVSEATATLESVRNAWADRFLKQGGRRQAAADIDQVNDAHALAMTLRLFLAADDLEVVDRIIAKYDQQLGSDPRAVIALVQSGETSLAGKLLENHRLKMRIESIEQLPAKYDLRVHEHRDAVAAEIEHPATAYFGQLILAAMGDPPGNDDAPSPTLPSRTERLSEAAQQFGDVDFSEMPGLQARVLDVLATDAAARRIVAAPLADHSASINFAALASRNEHEATQRAVRLVAAHIDNRLAENDATPLTETVASVRAEWQGDNHYYGQALPPLIAALDSAVKQYGLDWTAATQQQVAQALRDLKKGRQHVYLRDHSQYTRATLVVHALAGEAEAFAEWLASLSDYDRNQIRHSHGGESVWEVMREMYGPSDDDNRAERLAFLRNLLQMTADIEWIRRLRPWHYGMEFGNSHTLVDLLIEKELLTEQEALEHGSELVAGADGSLLVRAAVAGWLHGREQYAAAAPLWQTLTEADEEGVKHFSLAESHLGLAKALYETGNQEGAQTALAAVDVKKLGPGQPELYRELQQQLQPEKPLPAEQDPAEPIEPAA